jgi:hypothetical protein
MVKIILASIVQVNKEKKTYKIALSLILIQKYTTLLRKLLITLEVLENPSEKQMSHHQIHRVIMNRCTLIQIYPWNKLIWRTTVPLLKKKQRCPIRESAQ